MRFIAALAFAAALMAFLSMPVQAQVDECVSKETHIALMTEKYPKIIITDIAGIQEQIFLANLSKAMEQDYTSLDVLIHRHPGFQTTLVVFFDKGCAVLKGELPNEVVTKLLDGRDA